MRSTPSASLFLLVGLLIAHASNAHALCIYTGKHFEKSSQRDFNGRLYAKTTLPDEFADAKLVIRGTVLSSKDMAPDPKDPDSELGVLYRVKIAQLFKGSAPKIILDYSERNSGGFYLDIGSSNLLFLDPIDKTYSAAKLIPNAWVVNYNCGQSQPWEKLSKQDRELLNKLSAAYSIKPRATKGPFSKPALP